MISGNTITTGVGGSSRGIMIDGYSGVNDYGQIYDNYVDIQERPNPEYGLDFTTTALFLRTWQDAGWNNLSIYDNTFIAQTSEGMSYGAAGLRVTMPSNNNGTDLNNVIENNTFEAILEPTGNTYPDANYYAWAVLLEGVYANCCPLFIDNTFESNDTSLKLGSGDGYDVLDGNFISNTFSLSSVPSDLTYAAVTAGYSTGDLHNVTIIDPSYANGASQTVVWDPSALAWPSADGLPRTVDFGSLLTVEADDANGDPLSGAAVNVFDNSGNPVFSGVTGASGQLADISVVTTIYQQSATDPSDTTTQACGPFQVRVSLAGYATSTQTINLTPSATAQFQLSSGTVVTVNAPSNLSATAAASPASVSLSWTDNAANATSYTVERSDGTTGDWTVIASNLAATATQLHGQQRDGRIEL